MVQIYGAEETKAFCCNCKKVTVHKYENFAKPEKAQETEKKGFFSGLFASILVQLMVGEPTGDYKCKVCGTNLHTPDNLD
ncbi:hypothetical protein JL830_24950 [Vibrio parahaemolyticus]|uniref:hypothetical protein n=1 Tax=Vibrio parahaemolyticus TaxID=670 RepID=UPI001A8ED7E8|nr:hypothetical protein [Vibrio parahaemolyticus]MBO0180092.1 hypothetical protein [Vibrio parahaemolyticus]MCI9702123.1 hypothetical protein [Vibrio parahaemolyticus]MCR9812258.1 hypothetical protein [Vibrio parahaemolyticus]MDG2575781.1 hypothetical protein [Vibrio parahaemolyticus]HBC3568757.1 hypothetical protein [Vibrio parahaemolyticus]